METTKNWFSALRKSETNSSAGPMNWQPGQAIMVPDSFLRQMQESCRASSTSTWASRGDYEPAAVNTFLQVADYYLVAQAHAYNHIVVTHEISSASTRKIKIPNACLGLDIKCMTPYEMLRVEKARFVLGT